MYFKRKNANVKSPKYVKDHELWISFGYILSTFSITNVLFCYLGWNLNWLATYYPGTFASTTQGLLMHFLSLVHCHSIFYQDILLQVSSAHFDEEKSSLFNCLWDVARKLIKCIISYYWLENFNVIIYVSQSIATFHKGISDLWNKP